MAVFLDTSFYFSLISKKDKNHERAKSILINIAEGKYGIPYTSNFIMNETMTLLNIRTKGTRPDLLEKMSSLFIGKEPIAELIKINNNLLEDIVKLQIKLANDRQILSFTDCSSIILCKKLRIDNIITFDMHFKGFLNIIC